jgi:uncharacterized protein (TIGR02246 family)
MRIVSVLGRTVFLAVIVAAVTSCPGAPRGEGEDIQAAIQQANANFMAVFGSGDAAGLAALYTEDGQLLPANSDSVAGREAIQGFWQAVFDSGVKGAILETFEVTNLRGSASEVGQYTLSDIDGNAVDRGKYIVLWEKEDGEWKLHRDIWTTSLPAPVPEAPVPETPAPEEE